MSRVKRFAHSLVSGYALLGANVVYTLASVPVVLHYLTKDEFGLWALVTQFAGYLLLIDLGMSGSVSRILVDHKDDRDSTAYGSVIQTGTLVLLVQGVMIALGGACLSYWLPAWMAVPPQYWRVFRILAVAQCLIQAVTFVARIFGHVLQAHQRFDLNNYAQMIGVGISFLGLWVGLHLKYGLYSMILGGGLGCIASVVFMLVAALRMGVLPAPGHWGRPSWKVFRELFAFGGDLFLLAIGLQLNNASQILILSRTLGLGVAADWAIATKLFVLAQQFVSRIFDFSGSALSEMVVRGEQERLYRRFRELVVLTASVSVLAGAGLALCNSAFVQVWTRGRVQWSPQWDALLAWLLVATCVTRCHIGLLGQTKQIGAMRFIYLLEGITFVGVGVLVVPRFGVGGMLVTAIASNLVGSGIYGLRRTARYFHTTTREVASRWLAEPRNYLLLLWPLAAACWFATLGLPLWPHLAVNALVGASAGLVLLWRYGLTEPLRAELRSAISRARLRLASRA